MHYNFLRVPPSFWTLIRPALNLAALGLPIYGYTLLVSALDQVRWRPTMIGSVLTLAGFIAWVISVIPVLAEVHLEGLSRADLDLQALQPRRGGRRATSLGFNIAVLAGIGAACIVLAFVGFARRDLPANG